MADLSAGGGLSRFAHLTGGIAAKAKAEDDDKEKDAAKADEGDDDAKASDTPNGDDDEEDDKDDKKDEKAKGKAKSKASASAIRQDERNRCASIFAAPGAAGNVALAAELAFNTDLPASAAIALLAVSPGVSTARASNLSARMAAVPAITVGADTPAPDAPLTAQAEASAQASAILAGARAAGAKF